MDLSGLVVILILIVCISLWSIAFVQLNKYGGKKGIRQFFWMLLAMVLLSALLFLIFIVPSMGCYGFLCGFEDALFFLGGCLLLLILFPVIMITVHVSLLKRKKNKDLKG